MSTSTLKAKKKRFFFFSVYLKNFVFYRFGIVIVIFYLLKVISQPSWMMTRNQEVFRIRVHLNIFGVYGSLEPGSNLDNSF